MKGAADNLGRASGLFVDEDSKISQLEWVEREGIG
jgi:hypothetical protein